MPRKEKMKVYHGIPKSIADKNTIFYASFDSSIDPEVGATPCYNSAVSSFKPTPTGYGINSTSGVLKYFINNPLLDTTIDLIINDKVPSSSVPSGSNVNQRVMTIAPSMAETNGANILGDIIFYQDGLVARAFKGTNSVTLGVIRIPLTTLYNEYSFPLAIRYVITSTNLSLYLNGKLYDTKTFIVTNDTPIYSSTSYAISVGTHFSSMLEGYVGTISDFHISNIDRGNYFPNLPKDFIDGKAIIKERLGQQQIKGDPLITQETIVRIPPTGEEWVDSNGSSYGTVISKENPYIFSSNTDLYTTGHFTIVGLNNEVIGGVIDTDTVVCKIIKAIETNHLVVESLDGLSVGDKLRATKLVNGVLVPNDLNVYYRIDEIIPSTSSIKVSQVNGSQVISSGGWTQSAINSGYTLGYEVTEISSSPVVKSEDGTVVNGTWTGLGTNVAKFTVTPSQSHLQGKSVYATYSLNMPPGNSHFLELPSDIERAYTETGVEMKPVTSIKIEDDFRGKLPNNTECCPHISKFSTSSTTVLKPDAFLYECDNSAYTKLSKCGTTTVAINSTALDAIPQIMFSFNLIKIVESKLGCQIPGDKIEWLKNNCWIYIYAYAYGVNPTGNKVYLDYYENSEWRNTKATQYHAFARADILSRDLSIINNIVDSKGFAHFLIRGDKATETPSTIYVDYVKLDVIFKTGDSITPLFCGNRRAREEQCNPVLIEKATKTIKRFLPSSETFTTESLYYKTPKSTGTLGTYKPVVNYPIMYISTQGTGAYNDSKSDYYRECLARLGFTKYVPYEFTNNVLVNYNDSIGADSPTRFTSTLSDSYFTENYNTIPKDVSNFNGNFVALKPSLLLINGELVLNIFARVYKNGKSTNIAEQMNYKITNRPLIK